MSARYVPWLDTLYPDSWWSQSGADGGGMQKWPNGNNMSDGWKPRNRTDVGGTVEAETPPRYIRKFNGKDVLAWSTDGKGASSEVDWRYAPNFKHTAHSTPYGAIPVLDVGAKTSERLGTRTMPPMPIMEQSLDREGFINFGGSIQEGSVGGMGQPDTQTGTGVAAGAGLEAAGLDPTCTGFSHLHALNYDSKEPDGLVPAEVTYMKNEQSCSGAGVEPENGYKIPQEIQHNMGSEYSWDSKFANYIDRAGMVDMRDAISTSHLKNELLGQIDHINMLNNEEMNARVRESVGRMYLTANEPNYHDSMMRERDRALKATKDLKGNKGLQVKM